jgi:hypothetical protein
VTQFGEGASISLWRDDFMLMTRWPFTENQIGKVNHQTATCEMIGRERLGYGVRIHGSLQEFTGVSGVDRLAAPRVVPGFPLIVTPSVTGAIFLRNWHETPHWVAATTGLSLAQADLRSAQEQLELRVAERTADLCREVAEREVAQRELARAQQHMAETSRRAGMAEVANSVLHNVGNVLNSVNVSVTLLGEQLRSSPQSDLPRAAALLQAHLDDLPRYLGHDPQGRQLPDFLVLLGQQWQQEHELMRREVEQLTTSVQHIKDIVVRQQSLSGVSGVAASVDVPAVAAEVAALHGQALRQHRVELLVEHCGPVLWRGALFVLDLPDAIPDVPPDAPGGTPPQAPPDASTSA